MVLKKSQFIKFHLLQCKIFIFTEIIVFALWRNCWRPLAKQHTILFSRAKNHSRPQSPPFLLVTWSAKRVALVTLKFATSGSACLVDSNTSAHAQKLLLGKGGSRGSTDLNGGPKS